MGNDNHVVSHKLCGFQGCVGVHTVIMETDVVAPKFSSFSSDIFSQAFKNILVKVRIDHKFTGKHSSSVEKKKNNEHALW
jgi:hypothetical protein